ncbi:MAG: hypothetical protein PWP63_170 [Methanolobus sp.]|jgi:PAS domain S-box-containing protein|nr:hypothetical protein [Methanolobus sp.]
MEENNLKIRNRTLILLTVTFICLFVLLTVITGSIMHDSFSQLEKREVTTNVLRATGAVDSQTNRLAATAKDWGQWSDTVYFMQGDNAYIENNLDVESISNLQIDMMMFFDASGELYYIAGVDHYTYEEREITDAFRDYIIKEEMLYSDPSLDKYVEGIISTPEGPMMVGTSPITPNTRDSTIAGTIVIGKFLDPRFIEEMEETTQLSISISYPEPEATAALQSSAQVQDSDSIRIEYMDENTVIGTGVLNDINGVPSLALDVEMPRDVYQQGQSATHYVLYSIIAIGVIYGAVLILLIERSVLSRLTLLSSNLSAITESGSLSSRVKMDGDDELYMLADNINYMLQSLEHNEEKIHAVKLESQQKMEAVLKNILSGAMILDAHTHEIVDVNPAAEEIIGLPKKELVGRVCHDFVCPSEKGKCPISDLGMRVNKSECTIINAQGQKVWVLKSVVPVTLQGRDYFVESFVDLTKMKEAEEKLIMARITAEAANRAKSDFLATMSHELRTPLNSIIGFSDLIVSGGTGEISDTQKRFITNIATSGKHLLSIINNVLDISKIEANKMELNYQVFPVTEVFTEVKQLISPMAMKKELKVEFLKDEELTTIHADKTRFKQILFNLISNAIKFTPKGGSISVRASRNEEMAVFTVKDTGIGISEEGIAKLFQPFTQLDSAINRQYEGTGLGLSLVKKFLEVQNGSIKVESKLGEGTTFTFELPLTRNTDEKTVPEEASKADDTPDAYLPVTNSPVPTDGSQPLVLVVEDDDNSRELLQTTLEREGYCVTSTCCGKEALLLAEKLKPFAITLDIMMPGMDGWEVLKHLKEEDQTKDIPVIITSMLDEKEMSKVWGTVDYFIKPVPKEALVATLERIKDNTPSKRNSENGEASDN